HGCRYCLTSSESWLDGLKAFWFLLEIKLKPLQVLHPYVLVCNHLQYREDS
ncbi:hypothetical protein M8C21_014531, partial [Ambrosia artemisiifolia]